MTKTQKNNPLHGVTLAVVIKMKNLILIISLLLTGHFSNAQTNERWTCFWDKDSTKTGFKNSNGQVMIEPKFEGFIVAKEFDKIISVMDEVNGEYETYYYNQAGKKFGIDSVYFFDNTPDCESEGFIRFNDKKTDLVGMFDQHGEISIPAEYNALYKVQNGMVWALKNAEKEYVEEHHESGCNHFSWKGGQVLLISPTNQILIENFKDDGKIDFFSLEINQKSSTETNKVSFEGTNNKFYHFTDMEKDFKLWLETTLIPNLDKQKLIAFSMDSITFWKDGWTSLPNTVFMEVYFESVHRILETIPNSKSDYFVFIDGLNPFMYTTNTYDQYFNMCGEAYREKYPVMRLIINHKNELDLNQDLFDFLKTDKGYRLINSGY
jgi:hypothetical protein